MDGITQNNFLDRLFTSLQDSSKKLTTMFALMGDFILWLFSIFFYLKCGRGDYWIKVRVPSPGWGILQLQNGQPQTAFWLLHHTPSNALLFCQSKPRAGVGIQSHLKKKKERKKIKHTQISINSNCIEMNKCVKCIHKKQTSKGSIQDANCDGHQGPAFRTNICSTE